MTYTNRREERRNKRIARNQANIYTKKNKKTRTEAAGRRKKEQANKQTGKNTKKNKQKNKRKKSREDDDLANDLRVFDFHCRSMHGKKGS